MTDLSRTIAVKPTITYPREAQVGKTYLMTIDLQSEENFGWRYDEEEYPIYCTVDSELFSSKPVGEPVIVLHRFGGSYGEIKFLLIAAHEGESGSISVTLLNRWGVTVGVLNLESVKVSSRPSLTQQVLNEEGENTSSLNPNHSSGHLTDKDQFTIRFWGVRGPIACSGAEYIKYGGNTPCTEIQVGNKRLIFEGGTGLRVLGNALLEQMPLEAYLFFSHTHWGRIQGFPFFAPAFIEGNCLNIYGSIAPNGATLEQRLADQMMAPNFRVPIQSMQSDMRFYDFFPGEVLRIDGITIETGPLNHPNTSVGYRVSYQGCSVVHADPTEHYPDRLDENLLHLARNADVLIYGARYTDEEYFDPKNPRVGWGQSTWQAGVRLAKAASVRYLIIFNHYTDHDDNFLDNVEIQVNSAFPNSSLAKEGMKIDLRLPVLSSDEVLLEIST